MVLSITATAAPTIPAFTIFVAIKGTSNAATVLLHRSRRQRTRVRKKQFGRAGFRPPRAGSAHPGHAFQDPVVSIWRRTRSHARRPRDLRAADVRSSPRLEALRVNFTRSNKKK
jgi:hypothetical protein